VNPQVFLGNKPDPKKFRPVHNAPDFFWKPLGGLWTSTHTPDAEHPSSWVEWTEAEQFKVSKKRWLLQPRDDARVAVCATPGDLHAFLELYPRPVPPTLTGLLMMRSAALDYQKMTKDYDGLWIPSPWRWRFGLDEEYAYLSMFFYVMDSECTLWFDWVFDGIERLP
jgi:hypothetical protein